MKQRHEQQQYQQPHNQPMLVLLVPSQHGDHQYITSLLLPERERRERRERREKREERREKREKRKKKGNRERKG